MPWTILILNAVKSVSAAVFSSVHVFEPVLCAADDSIRISAGEWADPEFWGGGVPHPSSVVLIPAPDIRKVHVRQETHRVPEGQSMAHLSACRRRSRNTSRTRRSVDGPLIPL